MRDDKYIVEELRLREAILKKEASVNFSSFLMYINPKYEMEWFHRLIADKCQALFEGKIQNLMVFMPPQHGKSEIISRSFPAWVLGKNPDAKIVGTSYSSNLAEQFSRSIQRTIDSQAYHDVFPDTMLNNSPFSDVKKGYLRTIEIFETINHKGYYKAVGVGGSLTGTPADIAIIDDPVKDALEAYSELQRERVWDWYNSVLSTRLHNNSRQVFVMTRWHEDDLAGRILAREPDKWDVVSIPAICEKEGDGGISRRKVGEALWESRHSLDKLLAQKARSPQQFASLYQQRPTIEGGNVVKREWFQHISREEFNAMRWQEPINFYLDTAYDKKGARDNDPSGILAACKIKNNIYLVHAAKVYKEMPDLLRWLPTYVDTWGDRQMSMLCIEPKANGKSVIQMLKEMTDLNVKHTPSPTDSKMARICAVTPKIECGKVIIVDGDWTEDFLNELCGFPTAPHDEYVDILGYAINHLDGDTIEIPAYLDNMIMR